MTQTESTTVRLKVSPEVARVVKPGAPRDAQLAAARGALPLAGKDLLTVLFFLCRSSDAEIKSSAVKTLREAEGVNAFGPLSADTMFHAAARAGYDAALCMLHDQALIPAKTLAFDEAVNVTLGLPIVRTSPDHGTALDIAGKGVASPRSLISALNLAADMAAARRRTS